MEEIKMNENFEFELSQEVKELHENFLKTVGRTEATKKVNDDWNNFIDSILDFSREEITTTFREELNKSSIMTQMLKTKLTKFLEEASDLMVHGSLSEEEAKLIMSDIQQAHETIAFIDRTYDTGINIINNLISKIDDQAIEIDELLFKFLSDARTNGGYASPNPKVEEIGRHTKLLRYNNIEKFPGFVYADSYVGERMFSGSETVTIMLKPLYTLTYSGIEYIPFKDEPSIGECLNNAILAGARETITNPRGLWGEMDVAGKWVYVSRYDWDNSLYVSGREFIISREKYDELMPVLDVHDTKWLIDYISHEIEIYGYKKLPWLAFRCDFQGGFIR